PGVRALHRWGLVMVPLSYVTVGFQSMVQAGAGILRIAWWKYLIAQLPGAFVWGLFYATGGFLAWKYLFTQAQTYPYRAALVAIALLAVIAVIVRYRRNHPRPAACPIPGVGEEEPSAAETGTTRPEAPAGGARSISSFVVTASIAAPYRRSRRAYSRAASHRSRRSISGHGFSVKTISAYADCQMRKFEARRSPPVRQNMSTSGSSGSSRCWARVFSVIRSGWRRPAATSAAIARVASASSARPP